jgi:hypothetical protein
MSKLRSDSEIAAGWDGIERSKDGQVFEHYKGGTYKIVTTGFLEDSEAPCVVYRSLARNTVWVRTAKNFLEDVEVGGVVRPRFRPTES